MALQYVGGASATGTAASYTVSLTALTGGIGSAPIEGDIVVVCTAFGYTAASAPAVLGNNSGAYPNAFTALHVNDTWDTEFGVEYQVQGATPDTTLTISRVASTAYGGGAVAHVWRGADPTTPLDVTTLTATGSNGSRPNPPAITPVTAGAVVLACGAGTQGASGSAFTVFSGMGNAVSINADGSTSDAGVLIASVAWTSGSYDPAAATGGATSTSSSWAAATLVLRPFIDITAVGADEVDGYAVLQAVGLDDADGYSVQSAVGADAAAAYAVVSAVGLDQADAYAVTAITGQDLAGDYGASGAVGADAAGAYVALAGVESEASGAFGVLVAAGQDAAGSYLVVQTTGQEVAGAYGVSGTVGAELVGNFGAVGAVGLDLAGAFGVAGAVAADLADAYSLTTAVGASETGAYAVLVDVGADLAGSYGAAEVAGAELGGGYSLQAVTGTDSEHTYLVLQPAQIDVGDGYAITSAVATEAAGGYAVEAVVFANVLGQYWLNSDVLQVVPAPAGAGFKRSAPKGEGRPVAVNQQHPSSARPKRTNMGGRSNVVSTQNGRPSHGTGDAGPGQSASARGWGR